MVTMSSACKAGKEPSPVLGKRTASGQFKGDQSESRNGVSGPSFSPQSPTGQRILSSAQLEISRQEQTIQAELDAMNQEWSERKKDRENKRQKLDEEEQLEKEKVTQWLLGKNKDMDELKKAHEEVTRLQADEKASEAPATVLVDSVVPIPEHANRLPKTAAVKALQSIRASFNEALVPRCNKFLQTDFDTVAALSKEHTVLSELIFKDVTDKADALTLGGDNRARPLRKEIIDAAEAAQSVLGVHLQEKVKTWT